MLIDSRPMSLTVRARILRSQKGEAKVPDSTRLLELALKGLEAERAKIDDEIRKRNHFGLAFGPSSD